MKRLLLLTTTLLCMSQMRAYDWYDFKVDGIYYKLTYGAAEVYWGENKYTGDIVIPSTVTYNGNTYQVRYIGKEAFRDCTSLTSITIPYMLRIDDYAFYGCSNLTSVKFTGNVLFFGTGVFAHCSSLTTVTLPDNVTTIYTEMFTDCSKLESVTIPGILTKIEHHAFSGCSSLKTFSIPSSVTTIEHCVFMDCTSLTSVTIPKGITALYGSLFRGCTQLTTVNIPNNVQTIDTRAFYGCKNLTSITLPQSVESIGEQAFYGCSNLDTLTVKSHTPPTLKIYSTTFSTKPDIYVHPNAIKAYKSSNWQYIGLLLERKTTDTSIVFSQDTYQYRYKWEIGDDGKILVYEHYNYEFPSVKLVTEYGDILETSSLSYISSDTTIANISQGGNKYYLYMPVESKYTGKTTITAVFPGDESHEGCSGSCEVIFSKALTRLFFNPNAYSWVHDTSYSDTEWEKWYSKPTAELNFYQNDGGFFRMSSSSVIYTSDTPSVLDVDSQSGKITTYKPGLATVTATYPGNDYFEGCSASYTATIYDSYTPLVGSMANDWHTDALVPWSWTAPRVETDDDRTTALAEKYVESVEETGKMLWQRIEGLKNGQYQVEIYANACYTPDRGFDSSVTEGQEGIAYVYANNMKTYIPVHIGTTISKNGRFILNADVTDGTLELGLVVDNPGTNWWTIQIGHLWLINDLSPEIEGSCTSVVGIQASDWHADALIGWAAHQVATDDGRKTALAEKYMESVEETGTMLWQNIEGLENGLYEVALYANACYTPGRGFESHVTEGQDDIAYVYANQERKYIPVHVGTTIETHSLHTLHTYVTDGTLSLGLVVEKPGTNWWSIQIRSLRRIGDMPTQVEEVPDSRNKVANGDIYDLQGRRVEHITAPGLYIRSGRKIYVK